MTMDKLVEKVARAICKWDGADPDERLHRPRWYNYREEAEIAVAIVLEEAGIGSAAAAILALAGPGPPGENDD